MKTIRKFMLALRAARIEFLRVLREPSWPAIIVPGTGAHAQRGGGVGEERPK